MFKKLTLVCILLFLSSVGAFAAPINQYASSVISFSSEWSSGSWAAFQALGAPDTFAYGDIGSAWAPSPENGSLEFILLGFGTNVFADGVTIRETFGNGFVYQIDTLDTNDVLHTVWTGTDPSQPGSPVDFLATWARTSYAVKGIKIYTDTDHNPNAWEEIDSVQLQGDDTVPGASVPEPSSMLLLSAGMAISGMFRKRLSR